MRQTKASGPSKPMGEGKFTLEPGITVHATGIGKADIDPPLNKRSNYKADFLEANGNGARPSSIANYQRFSDGDDPSQLGTLFILEYDANGAPWVSSALVYSPTLKFAKSFEITNLTWTPGSQIAFNFSLEFMQADVIHQMRNGEVDIRL
ncbi:hypothetical protein A0O30_04195 [Pseudomonas sp. LLC-1]|uniref:hypothetical protein n=1 Tax=Pseudomonas sp. LLC-1 TaxID=1812180 RepID=UPI000D01C925|nr:hypothetical protein [Pseudomonas sp. LLC-1]PRN06265.1 hypothetical protein A0O30_04195 [Pseudomonas sp. LLC-1]